MKKLFHYIIIFLVIYWCFNNIKGCSVPEVAKVPQIEEQEHFCGDCTEPIEEVPQEQLDSTNANLCYRQLKSSIIRNEAKGNTFVELRNEIDVQSPRSIVVTIYYTIVNDKSERVSRKCVGVHKFNGEGEMSVVDIKDERIL